MQVLLTETKTKEKLQKKRNLFGLGVTSLIAACAGDEGAAGDTVTLSFKAADLSGTAQGKSGFTATIETTANELPTKIDGKLDVKIAKDGEPPKFLTFSDGIKDDRNTIGIYKLTTATDPQYDLVVSSPTIDDKKGRIFIFWDITTITQSETIGTSSRTANPTNSITVNPTNQRLEIKGRAANDTIGLFAPEFLQIGGTVNNYDMVFGGASVDRAINVGNTGAIYILWDVADYAGANKTIDIGSLTANVMDNDIVISTASGLLAIYGAIADYIGQYAPQLLELGGADNAYDMVIRSRLVDKSATMVGAIYVLWDVTGYHDTKALHKTVTLDNSLVDDSGAYTNGAAYGLLAIYGAKENDYIGTNAPEFLQIAGKADNYDMVISSEWVNNPYFDDNPHNGHGAIYILWDVADYAGKNKSIDLGKLDVTGDLGLGANAGSLAIYGAKVVDAIGTYAPEFLQIGGKDGNYDMVIRSQWVDKVNVEGRLDEGAIYILWDVADYYKNTSDQIANKFINFATPVDATSGLLTIYGRGNNAKLGEKDDANNINNNILYNADGQLTNIDNDSDGTKDIAITDGKYTYIFFGDKIADTGGDEKVDSKTIDLGTLDGALGVGMAGFFEYDFTANNGLGSATTSSKDAGDRVGYRFADNAHTTLAAVEGAYPSLTALSDADADLGVWDIA